MEPAGSTLAPVQTATKAIIGVAAVTLGTLSITLAGVYVKKTGSGGITGVDWTVPEKVDTKSMEIYSLIPLLHVHYILMTMAVVLSSFAVLSFAVLPGNKILRKAIHSSLQGGALLLYTLGLVAAVRWHHKIDNENFVSAHSWFGVSAYIMFAIIWLSGLTTFGVPGVPESFKATVIGPHMILGAVAFGSMIISAALGAAHVTDALTFAYKVGVRARSVLIMNFLALTLLLLGVLAIVAHALVRPHRKAEERRQDGGGGNFKSMPMS